MREAIEAEQQREAQVETAFQGLTIAQRYQRQGNYAQAAAVYREFLEEVAPAPGSVQYNEALTGFVRVNARRRIPLLDPQRGPRGHAASVRRAQTFEEMFEIL